MAVTELYNIDKEKVGEVELNDNLFCVEVNKHILHDVVRMQRANRRSGNACTKTRVEVHGSSSKPYKQKGTGRARAGSVRSPLWRGGGVTFGPKPRDYSYELPKKVKKLGIRMALSARFSEKNLMVLDSFKMEDIKTQKFAAIIDKLELSNVLIIIPGRDEVLEKSSRNIHGVKVLSTEGINVYDILHHKKLVLLQSSLEQLEERLQS